VILPVPSKPMTSDWMTELEAQVALTSAAQRRRGPERARSKLPSEDENADPEQSEQNPLPLRGRLDFLA